MTNKMERLTAYRTRVSSEKHSATLRAAQELFATRGFLETTMADIAQHADVSTATLYKHFTSKEDLFAACIEAFDNRELDITEKAHQFLNCVARSTLKSLELPAHRTEAQAILRRFITEM